MNVIKKSLVLASLFTLLFAGMPKQEAKAGIILAPAGIGVFLIIYGILIDSIGLVILDDGAPANQLVGDFQNRYGHLTSNQNAFVGLATMVANALPTGEITSEIEIKFSKAEIVRALGSAAANKKLVDAVANDLM